MIKQSDLELFSTTELIEEMMRRKAFLGVVVHAKEDFKSNEWHGEGTFQVHYNSNLEPDQVRHLFDSIADYMER